MANIAYQPNFIGTIPDGATRAVGGSAAIASGTAAYTVAGSAAFVAFSVMARNPNILAGGTITVKDGAAGPTLLTYSVPPAGAATQEQGRDGVLVEITDSLHITYTAGLTVDLNYNGYDVA